MKFVGQRKESMRYVQVICPTSKRANVVTVCLAGRQVANKRDREIEAKLELIDNIASVSGIV